VKNPENKMSILIQQLALDDADLMRYLQMCTLKAVVVDRMHEVWEFELLAPSLIRPVDFVKLVHLFDARFPYAAKINFQLIEETVIDSEAVEQFLAVFMDERFLDSHFLLQALDHALLNFSASVLYIGCADAAQQKKFEEKKQELIALFARVGVTLSIEIAVDPHVEQRFAQMVQSYEVEKVARDAAHVAELLQAQPQKSVATGEVTQGRAQKDGTRGRSAKGNFAAKTLERKQPICELHNIGENVIFEGYVFDKEVRKTRTGKFIMTLKVTDYSDSIYVSKWLKDSEEMEEVNVGTWLNISGKLEIDPYKKHQRNVRLNKYEVFVKPVKKDTAEKKRIELHAHTKMSQLDGVISAEELVGRAIQFEHEAVAVTDHAVVHSFPNAFHASGGNKKIKVLYGAELNVVDYRQTDIFYPINETMAEETMDGVRYIVFDIETTGLSQNFNKIIEVAAIKIENGLVVDTYESFVNPEELLRPFTMELTGITQQDVKQAPKIEQVMSELLAWTGHESMPTIFVAHNAHFDVPFIQAVYKKIHNRRLPLHFIDTLTMARHLYPQLKRHGLKALTKFFNVGLDQHHRAIADTKATAEVFLSMLQEYKERGHSQVGQFNAVVTRERSHQIAYSFHLNVLAQNDVGLKNLFKIVSYAHVDYFVQEARVPLDVLEAHREGLLFGSACQNNEVFQSFLSADEAQTRELMAKYDYIEVQPPAHYAPLVYAGTFQDERAVEEVLAKFIQLAQSEGKLVVATGDVHQLDERDTLIRQIYINTQPLHALSRKEIKSIPSTQLLTTGEMQQAFSFLGDSTLIDDIVITNTHKVAAMIQPLMVIKDKLFTPSMDNVEENVRTMVMENAQKLYGTELPQLITERIDTELTSIIGHGFAVIYYICYQIVKKSLDDGYVVGSRGSVGSSLVATLMDITEVNPLPPHYRCPSCQYSEFHGGEIGSGFDLPDKTCPKCNEPHMVRDGHDIPFETFLGFEGDKVPDIDLNFSGEYQSQAHDYTKVLFGEDNVYRAGTISTIADKTAYGYVRGYLGDHPDVDVSLVEVDRLTSKVSGVKKTTGKHAGGIIVVPDDMEIYDITPVQYPADGKTGKDWKTTHFDFHAIHDNLLKLDLLGHDDPTIIRMLEDLSGIAPRDIPLNDESVYALFSSKTSLQLEKDIPSSTGSLGIPEFGTDFVRQMLVETKPSTFAELVQISGLSHGTDVWINNAQVLVESGTATLKEIIGCRDDIMVYLIYKGMKPSDAFTIMELTRKGKFTEKQEELIEKMREQNVPNWYIESCMKIKYMFPKAHATAYVMSAMRIAWFKVHKPLYFYASLFSVRQQGKSFEIETIMGGYEAVKARIIEIEQMETPTNRDLETKGILDIVLEMQARGFGFKQVDLYKSSSNKFTIEADALVFPFQAVDGLGENVAKLIIEEREKGIFLSKEDLQKRTSVSKTVLAKLEVLHVLEGLDDHNQMSLF